MAGGAWTSYERLNSSSILIKIKKESFSDTKTVYMKSGGLWGSVTNPLNLLNFKRFWEKFVFEIDWRQSLSFVFYGLKDPGSATVNCHLKFEKERNYY